MRISDWSSDVCSSDLANDDTDQRVGHRYFQSGGDPDQGRRQHNPYRDVTAVATHDPHRADQVPRYLLDTLSRGDEHEEEDISEASRVGKECVSKCRSRCSPDT